ncbi:MAG: cytochrome c [Arenicellales bacterium]|nr:cytochrome c [Arenicellales bacterium]MDP6290573.1 cytochrome c [Arenicellales bacterium]HJL56684.1 cytochrome c [Arenicellales bacterium]
MTRVFLMALLIVALGPVFTGAAQAADGKALFGFYCAQCHGTEGEGDGPNVTGDFPVDPRNFTETAEMEKISDADIRNVIIDGGPIADKSPMMPPWGKTLTDAEIEALVGYLRQLCNCTGKTG